MTFTVPLRILQIESQGIHVAVSGFVNGNLTNILIDTGASQTVFDKNRVGLFSTQSEFEKVEKVSKGLGTNSMEGYRFEIAQFVLGDMLLYDFEVVLLDLAHINESYGQLGLSPIDIVLGGDFLAKHNAVIDYGNKELQIEFNR